MEQSSDPQSVHIVGHDGLDHHHHHHHAIHHHHAHHHHLPHAATLHHANNLHHHSSLLQEPLPTVEVVDQTATGLPLPPSILASYYAAAVAASGVDTSSAAAAAANGTPGSSGGSLGVGEGHGEGSIAGGNHMTVGTPPATRKRGRPRKPPTPYNCAFVGCQKQITKRRFCAAHQKRRERARKKAQQQQQIQSVGGQPTDVGAGVQGVGEDQQALLANLPPLPPMLQEAAVASGQPLMMPYQLQMMAELNKQQSYEQQAYDGQHHVAQQGYEPHHDGQPAYDIAQQAYEQVHEQAQQQISYVSQEETYEGSYVPRKRKREDAEDTSPETIAQTSEEHLPAHRHEDQVGDQDEAHNNSGLPPQGDQEQHEQGHAHPNEHEQTQQEDWSTATLVVGQGVPLSGDDAQHDELGHGLHDHGHDHVQQAQHREFQVVEGHEAATPHLPPQQPNERKTDLPGAEDGEPGGAEGHEARWV